MDMTPLYPEAMDASMNDYENEMLLAELARQFSQPAAEADEEQWTSMTDQPPQWDSYTDQPPKRMMMATDQPHQLKSFVNAPEEDLRGLVPADGQYLEPEEDLRDLVPADGQYLESEEAYLKNAPGTQLHALMNANDDPWGSPYPTGTSYGWYQPRQPWEKYDFDPGRIYDEMTLENALRRSAKTDANPYAETSIDPNAPYSRELEAQRRENAARLQRDGDIIRGAFGKSYFHDRNVIDSYNKPRDSNGALHWNTDPAKQGMARFDGSDDIIGDAYWDGWRQH